ncbi:MAG: hypothetical protein KKC99_11445, partial [Proteobacteria bacterium]|nr:hypothetical protein [Pseudomonadota bacterium]
RLSVERREPMMDIENHELPRLLADSIQLGLLRGTRTLGMEAGFLALPRALWLLLEYGVEECANRWLRQEPFFGLRKEW